MEDQELPHENHKVSTIGNLMIEAVGEMTMKVLNGSFDGSSIEGERNVDPKDCDAIREELVLQSKLNDEKATQLKEVSDEVGLLSHKLEEETGKKEEL